MITPEFLETQRNKDRNDIAIDRVLSNPKSNHYDPNYTKFRAKYTAKYGNTSTGTLLDFAAYGTTQPTERWSAPVPELPGATLKRALTGLLRQPTEEERTEMHPDTPESLEAEGKSIAGEFFGGIKEDFTEARDIASQNLVEAMGRQARGEQGLVDTAATLTGQTGVVAAKVFGSLLGKTLSAVTPDVIEDPLRVTASDAFKGVLTSRVGQATAEKLGGMFEKFEKYEQEDPVGAARIESVLGIGQLALTLVGAEKTISGVSKLATKGLDKVDDLVTVAAEKQAAKKALTAQTDDALKLAQPKANRKEIFRAAREGRTIENISGEPIGITPGAREVEVGGSMRVAGVTDKMSPTKATAKVGKEIGEVGDDIEREIAAHNFAFNDKEARGVLDAATKAAQNNAVISTTTEETTFRKIADVWMNKFKAINNTPLDEIVDGTKNVKGTGGNRALSWYRTRKAMDKIAPPKTFGGDSTMNAKVNAFRAFRDAGNEFMATSLEANGSAYGARMRYLTNLFRGLDALETTVPTKLSPTSLQKALSIGKKALMGIGAYAALKKATPFGNLIP